MKPFMVIIEEKSLSVCEYLISVSKKSTRNNYNILLTITNRASSYVFVDNLWHNKSFQNSNRKFHNIHGPALIQIDEINEYYFNGKYFTKEEWEKNRKEFL